MSRVDEPLDTDLKRRLADMRLLALDVDGVLTDGRVVYIGETEAQAFHVRDGQGLVWLQRAGVAVTWITGRGCEATTRRAAELGVRELHMRVSNKEEVLADVQKRLGVSPEETSAMGDDLADLALARRAGVFFAPADASGVVRDRADLVTRASGGKGAVREVVEHLLRAKGLWQQVVDAAG